ncbi:MAG: type II secretion system major pseudopilin GspG [Candidatus Omnitrophica bacterium]|nr:type II secretion system major pseudopilin GspG [Candidatus Omnitrophota bacterium]
MLCDRETKELKNRFFSSSVLPFFSLRGFTLIELMLVVVIISALAAMVVPRLAGRTEEARRSIAEADIKGNLSLALKLFEVDNGRYPTTEQGLGALLQKPAGPPVPKNWKGPYLEQDPLDPWGKPYVYRRPGMHPPRDYDLSSLGPDGVESADDVKNW